MTSISVTVGVRAPALWASSVMIWVSCEKRARAERHDAGSTSVAACQDRAERLGGQADARSSRSRQYFIDMPGARRVIVQRIFHRGIPTVLTLTL
jgi:hypothetical protein